MQLSYPVSPIFPGKRFVDFPYDGIRWVVVCLQYISLKPLSLSCVDWDFASISHTLIDHCVFQLEFSILVCYLFVIVFFKKLVYMLCMHVCAYVHPSTCTHMQRPEKDVRCPHLSPSFLFPQRKVFPWTQSLSFCIDWLVRDPTVCSPMLWL